MTEENFKRAKELNASIKHMSFELGVWANCVEIVSIKIKDNVSGKTTEKRNEESLDNFQQIKEFVIKKKKKKLDEAKYEFEKL